MRLRCGNGYFKTLSDYVHFNISTRRANLLTAEQLLKAYPWNSYPLYLDGRP